MCCPGPGSVSKESDSGPFSFSEGIPRSFAESQLDVLNDPVKGLEAMLRVRERGGLRVPPPARRVFWLWFGD